jgi:hypothetical protein
VRLADAFLFPPPNSFAEYGEEEVTIPFRLLLNARWLRISGTKRIKFSGVRNGHKFPIFETTDGANMQAPLMSQVSRSPCKPSRTGRPPNAAGDHKWTFQGRFRRHAFGWKSQPAIQRLKQALSEIKRVARDDPVLAADGAVILLERLSPALEQVDSSSGAIGTAVNNAIAELVPIIARAPAATGVRESWLERLWTAHEADQIPYIESLADYWGELCASKEVANTWADRLVGITRMALSPAKNLRGYFHGTSACLSALYRAERYSGIVDLLQGDQLWQYKRWAVKALDAMGKKREAIEYAEACRGPWTSDAQVDELCEGILLDLGQIEEAYERYALRPRRGSTYLASLKEVAKKYSHKSASEILVDLVKTTPGEEGKWFAAAKEVGLYDEALALASRTPCDPKTLTRAARDFSDRQPSFALGAGLLALHWLTRGYGYEITGLDIWAAYSDTMKAAEKNGNASEIREKVKQLVADEAPGGFVRRVLGRELGL